MSERAETRGANPTIGAVAVVSGHSPIAAILWRSPPCVDGSCVMSGALRAMHAAGVAAVVVDDRGLLTESDVARALAAGRSLDEPVGPIADPDPVVIVGSTTIFEVAALMLNHRASHLVVTVEDRVHVVALGDVVPVLLQVADPELWLDSLRRPIDVPSEVWLG